LPWLSNIHAVANTEMGRMIPRDGSRPRSQVI